jgi:hypothetical protein
VGARGLQPERARPSVGRVPPHGAAHRGKRNQLRAAASCGSAATGLPWGARSSAFKVQGSTFKVRCSDVRPLRPLFPCPRTNLEYHSWRWCRASAFPSHAGNRRSIGPPTQAHEDMFTGPQHTLTLGGNLRSPHTMSADVKIQFTMPDVLIVPPASQHGKPQATIYGR